MRNRTLLFLSLSFALSACGGPLYKVAPLLRSAPPEISADNANALSAGAMALEGDSAIERFDANLPLAGVIAIDVRLINRASEAIDLSKLKFELREAGGANLKALSPKQALKNVMKYNEDRFYTLAARAQTREDYDAVALKVTGEIAPREDRRGVLFFQMPRGTSNVSGLTMSIKGAAAPINVQVSVR